MPCSKHVGEDLHTGAKAFMLNDDQLRNSGWKTRSTQALLINEEKKPSGLLTAEYRLPKGSIRVRGAPVRAAQGANVNLGLQEWHT